MNVESLTRQRNDRFFLSKNSEQKVQETAGCRLTTETANNTLDNERYVSFISS